MFCQDQEIEPFTKGKILITKHNQEDHIRRHIHICRNHIPKMYGYICIFIIYRNKQSTNRKTPGVSITKKQSTDIR